MAGSDAEDSDPDQPRNSNSLPSSPQNTKGTKSGVDQCSSEQEPPTCGSLALSGISGTAASRRPCHYGLGRDSGGDNVSRYSVPHGPGEHGAADNCQAGHQCAGWT